ncbi:MAG TPA: carboxylesterase family protein [Gemmataceae bacterium]|nr:carboxylesterase family protein [Terriglobia bacterium]HZV07725.1 carboxylesterase family protein [Gemmataceae bacterium]
MAPYRKLSLPLMFLAMLTAASAHADAGPRVTTAEGTVEGVIANGANQFLGIPYAEPPVGNLRWRPAVLHAPWKGVLKAIAYAPICAQGSLGPFSGPPNSNEDCLYLNVFTPINPPAREKLPVIFWIYGGGDSWGETPGYDGSKLAAQGNTVVVTVGYRLNVFGFFAHPAIDKEGHLAVNYGLTDQLAGLRWVQRNIGYFGGDKNNVTISGQSVGAEDVGMHMVSPLAKGLFHKAICMSACPSTVFGGTISTMAAAETKGITFSVAAGCGAGTDATTAKCLRSLPAAQVEALAGSGSSGIVMDGTMLPNQPLIALIQGQFNHVPLMNGNTRDEENFFLGLTEYNSSTVNADRTPPTAAQYLNFVNTFYVPPTYPAGTAARVLARYPLSAYPSPQLAWNAAAKNGDSFLCAGQQTDRVLASQIPVYAYEFDDRTAPSYFPQMPGFVPLAYHTADLQYVFPLWHGGPTGIEHPLNREQEMLSDELVAAWTNFAWTGNPNGHGSGSWPLYQGNAGSPAFLSEETPALSTLTNAQYSSRHMCNFWDALYPLP